jgi:hypothetical protein
MGTYPGLPLGQPLDAPSLGRPNRCGLRPDCTGFVHGQTSLRSSDSFTPAGTGRPSALLPAPRSVTMIDKRHRTRPLRSVLVLLAVMPTTPDHASTSVPHPLRSDLSRRKNPASRYQFTSRTSVSWIKRLASFIWNRSASVPSTLGSPKRSNPLGCGSSWP